METVPLPANKVEIVLQFDGAASGRTITKLRAIYNDAIGGYVLQTMTVSEPSKPDKVLDLTPATSVQVTP